jgi:thiamine-phosphate pyrophosphorylase
VTPLPKSKSPIPRLYAIVDADVADRAGWTLIDLASACLDGGARCLQIRAKQASSAWLLDAASAIADRAHRSGAVLIVNDRLDIAMLSDADGVHVGQDDLPASAVRTRLGPDKLIGLSTHTQEQLEAARLEPVSYVAIGPVFATLTKTSSSSAIGLDMVRKAAAVASESALPLVAIGGITLERAPDVIRAGASSVAVISDLLAGGSPEARVRAYVRRLAEVREV